MYTSNLTTSDECWIKIPKYCIVLNASISEHPRYFGSSFKIIKPMRKMHEYEDYIERGIIIEVDNEEIRDIHNYPDFSAQLMGIALSGFLYSILFKLFG
jgi:hypothetical protein